MNEVSLIASVSDVIAVAKEEKARRVYYQNIVYEICKIIDETRGDGKTTVCGTVDSPSNEVQTTLRNLLANHEPKF